MVRFALGDELQNFALARTEQIERIRRVLPVVLQHRPSHLSFIAAAINASNPRAVSADGFTAAWRNVSLATKNRTAIVR